MEHIGIDLGSRTSHICVMEVETAKVRLQTKVATRELCSWLSRRSKGRVVMETCTESFAIADQAQMLGHEVFVVPASLVRQLGVGNRGQKNDRRDARVLVQASLALRDELPSVHIPAKASRELRRLLTLRSALVKSRMEQVVMIKALLRSDLQVLPKFTTASFPKRLRAELADDPRLAVLEPMLVALESLTTSIAAYDALLDEASKDEVRIKRLKTIPGVGPIVATMLVAVIDDESRFKTGAQLASYMGLTPGERTTGGKEVRTGITRAGQSELRSHLIQACWCHSRVAPNSALSRHYQRIAEHRPKQVAIVAMARKLCHVVHAMLTKQEGFDMTRGVPPEAPSPDAHEALVEALREGTVS